MRREHPSTGSSGRCCCGPRCYHSSRMGYSHTLVLAMTGLGLELVQGTWALMKKKGMWLIFPVDQHWSGKRMGGSK